MMMNSRSGGRSQSVCSFIFVRATNVYTCHTSLKDIGWGKTHENKYLVLCRLQCLYSVDKSNREDGRMWQN